MVVAAEHLLVRAEVEPRQVEVGQRVAVADVEEEVRRAFVVAVLEHLDQRESEDTLEELHGALDVAADQRDVMHTAGGAGRAVGLRCEVLCGKLVAAGGRDGRVDRCRWS